VQLELQAREHIDVDTGCLTHKHTNRRDVEQCRASVDSRCVTSNLECSASSLIECCIEHGAGSAGTCRC